VQQAVLRLIPGLANYHCIISITCAEKSDSVPEAHRIVGIDINVSFISILLPKQSQFNESNASFIDGHRGVSDKRESARGSTRFNARSKNLSTAIDCMTWIRSRIRMYAATQRAVLAKALKPPADWIMIVMLRTTNQIHRADHHGNKVIKISQLRVRE
jgi:hypothetical protein